MLQSSATTDAGTWFVEDREAKGAQPAAPTLVDLLRQRAADPESICRYTFLHEDGSQATWTVQDVEQRAVAIAAALHRNCTAGDRVLLVYPPGLDFVPAFLGCMCAGVLPVPATYPKPRRPMPRLTSISQDCGAQLALTTSATLETLELTRSARELSSVQWMATDALPNSPPSVALLRRPEPHDLAFLQYTSGSTSEPKGVMVTHANLMHNLGVIKRAFGVERLHEDGVEATSVWWLPAYHDMGLIGGILGALYNDGRLVMMPPATFLKRPLVWLKAMSEHHATVSGAPNFAYEMCVAKTSPAERRRLDLSRWRLAFCGAEPVRAETLGRFAEAFAPCGFRASSFYPCYGLAEATLLATGGDGPAPLVVKSVHRDRLADHEIKECDATDGVTSQKFVACGRPWLGQEVLIVDGETRVPLPKDRVGEIWIRGASVAAGYWNRPDETAVEFNATRADDPSHQYLRTGDLGFITDGQLFVTGRSKEVIIVRGRNFYPQDIEVTVGRSHASLAGGAGAAFAIEVAGEERLVAVHEVDRQYRGEFDEVFRSVRRAVVDDHELDPHGIVLIRQASLPRTTSGKTQRSLCRQQYLSGELNVVAQWTRGNGPKNDVSSVDLPERPYAAESPERPRKALPIQPHDRTLTAFEMDRLADQLETWLMEWLVERAGVSPKEVDRHRPFAEYGLDSLMAVELSQELEDGLRVKLTPVVAWNYPTPATLAKYLATIAGGSAIDQELERPTNPEGQDDGFTALLSEIELLSDEEARSQLDGDEANR